MTSRASNARCSSGTTTATRNRSCSTCGAPPAREHLLRLLGGADILLDASCGALNEALGLDRAALNARFPQLVTARMTPFGDDGPWNDFKGSDLIHLALGGPMMNCGYDPDPNFEYDTPPIAPQIWHAYHIAGEQMATGIIAALIHRERSGEGQDVSVAIHEAVSKNPEQDIMYWVMRRVPLWRLTCRHAGRRSRTTRPSICHTKDGRWFITHGMGARDLKNLVPLLSKYDAQADLQPPPPEADLRARQVPGHGGQRRGAVAHARCRAALCPRLDLRGHAVARGAGCRAAVGAAAQAARERARRALAGAQDLRRCRASRSSAARFRYPTSKWLSNKTSWQVGRRAPLLGEDTEAVLGEAARAGRACRRSRAGSRTRASRRCTTSRSRCRASRSSISPGFSPRPAARGFSRRWARRATRSSGRTIPTRGWRRWRRSAAAPRAMRRPGRCPGSATPTWAASSSTRTPASAASRSTSATPRALQIAKDMVRICDVVAEGFSPGVLQRLGLGYDVLKSIRPDIIYIQQSGMGAHGTYGRMRTVGPVAAAFGGQAEMSGLPEPAMPVSWGYSYLDWMGAYGYALALLGAIYHRERTGEGQWIDASQCESGIFLTGATILDWSANERVFRRYGNRSPYKPAAPHGAYRCEGKDRWIAIACFTDAEWQALAQCRRARRLARRPPLRDARAAGCCTRMRSMPRSKRGRGRRTATTA